jgi:BlaI family transcriptional regulator, penicillinase repressor
MLSDTESDYEDRYMVRDVQNLPDAELAVLQTLWERGPSTIRQLTDALYPSGSDAYYATVQKLLERLEAKACVSRDRSSWAHVFQATMDRDELIGRRLQAVAEKLCGGSLTPLLTNLVRSKRLTPKERREIRKLMDELDR